VYKPLELIVPDVADQVTAVLEVPETVAVSCSWAPPWTDVFAGEMAMATVCVALTTTTAEACFEESALLTAVTV
jgi:hypothetical protein